jgi:hypothetical protein
LVWHGGIRAAASQGGMILIVSLIISAILGAVVAGLTGIGFLFWVVSIFVFICSLPFVLVDGYIQDKIDYVQDREDYRETMREIAEEERMDRYLENIDEYDDEPVIYIDNRQVHFHNHYGSNRDRDDKGRFISTKGNK